MVQLGFEPATYCLADQHLSSGANQTAVISVVIRVSSAVSSVVIRVVIRVVVRVGQVK